MFGDFSVGSIFGGLIFGAVGLWMIRMGRSRGNLRVALVGLVLIGFPYFVPNPWALWGIGAALCFLASRVWE